MDWAAAKEALAAEFDTTADRQEAFGVTVDTTDAALRSVTEFVQSLCSICLQLSAVNEHPDKIREDAFKEKSSKHPYLDDVNLGKHYRSNTYIVADKIDTHSVYRATRLPVVQVLAAERKGRDSGDQRWDNQSLFLASTVQGGRYDGKQKTSCELCVFVLVYHQVKSRTKWFSPKANIIETKYQLLRSTRHILNHGLGGWSTLTGKITHLKLTFCHWCQLGYRLHCSTGARSNRLIRLYQVVISSCLVSLMVPAGRLLVCPLILIPRIYKCISGFPHMNFSCVQAVRFNCSVQASSVQTTVRR
ncbi:hypothetical protein CLF_111836 [Clonorchis sinensis]|uniref:Uncharacterized protein n=1 Tax=Clonorchis sinensis TaxID=79923 RepID=G7YVE4_CLOSI|nr:hypothetical protein CLF_111836 [Clonorchis sinensis]